MGGWWWVEVWLIKGADREKEEEMVCWVWRRSITVTVLTERFVLSLLQEASGSRAGEPEWCAGCAGGAGEGDGQHQPTCGTQELHCPECNWGCWERRLFRGQALMHWWMCHYGWKPCKHFFFLFRLLCIWARELIKTYQRKCVSAAHNFACSSKMICNSIPLFSF